jgi:hypothetical protein
LGTCVTCLELVPFVMGICAPTDVHQRDALQSVAGSERKLA